MARTQTEARITDGSDSRNDYSLHSLRRARPVLVVTGAEQRKCFAHVMIRV